MIEDGLWLRVMGPSGELLYTDMLCESFRSVIARQSVGYRKTCVGEQFETSSWFAAYQMAEFPCDL